MQALKSRLLALSVVLALLGWGLFVWAIRRPIPHPTERVVEHIVYRDRAVDKVVEKKTTKPSGAVVETRSVTRTVTQETSGSTSNTSITPAPALPQYSLGLSWSPAQVVGIEAGVRLGELPLWLTTSLNTKKEVAVGFRLEF